MRLDGQIDLRFSTHIDGRGVIHHAVVTLVSGGRDNAVGARCRAVPAEHMDVREGVTHFMIDRIFILGAVPGSEVGSAFVMALT